jgi:hypothetical protein
MRGPITSGTNYGGGLIRYLPVVRDLSAVKSAGELQVGLLYWLHAKAHGISGATRHYAGHKKRSNSLLKLWSNFMELASREDYAEILSIASKQRDIFKRVAIDDE